MNKHCKPLPVQFDDLRALRLLFHRRVRSLFSFDLKDGYHHVSIHRDAWHLFQFHIQGEYFEATTLPFGWNQSPALFVRWFSQLTNWLKAPMQVAPHFPLSRTLARYRFSLLAYLDDMLFVSYMGPQRTRELVTLLRDIFQLFGVALNEDKCEFAPSQVVSFLGYDVHANGRL